MPWKPEDRCSTDAVTLKRIGPSGLSTFFFVFFGVLLFFNVLSVLFWSKFKTGNQKLLLYFSILFNLFTYYLYWAFYSQCRPWTGWMLYMFLGFVIMIVIWAILAVYVAAELNITVEEKIHCSQKDGICLPQQPIVIVNPIDETKYGVWKQNLIKNNSFQREDIHDKTLDLQTTPPEKRIEHWRSSGRVLHVITPLGMQMQLHPGALPSEINQTIQVLLSGDTPYRLCVRGYVTYNTQLVLCVCIGRYTLFKITPPTSDMSTGFSVYVNDIILPEDVLQNTVLSIVAHQKNRAADSQAKIWLTEVMFGY